MRNVILFPINSLFARIIFFIEHFSNAIVYSTNNLWLSCGKWKPAVGCQFTYISCECCMVHIMACEKRSIWNAKHIQAKQTLESLIVIFPLDYRNQDEINNENTFQMEKRDQMVRVLKCCTYVFRLHHVSNEHTHAYERRREKNLCLIHMSHILCSFYLLQRLTVCVGFFCLFPWSLKSKQQNTTQKQSAIAQNKQEMMRRKREKVLFFMWIPIGRKSFICETKKRTQEENKKLNKIVKCVQLPNFRSLLVRYGRLRSAYSARTHMSSIPSRTISPIERQTLCVFVCASMREYTYITFDLSPYRNAFKQ